MKIHNFREFFLEEVYLVEDRIDFLKDKYNKQKINTEHDEDAEHKEPADIVSHFAQHGDPSQKKAYTDWIVDKYGKGQFRQEDADNVRNSLSHFDKHKAKLEKRDINQYKSLEELDDAVRPHIGTASTKREKAEQIKNAGIEKVVGNDKAQVYHVKNKDASCEVYGGGSERGGTGTNWCTAARSDRNMFESYNKRGNLYTFHIDGDAKSPYQMHMSPEGKILETMDRHNHPASAGELVNHVPELRGHPDFKGKHPIFDKPEDMAKKLHDYDNTEYVRSALQGGSHLEPHQYEHLAKKAVEGALKSKDSAEYEQHKNVISALIHNKNLSGGAIEHLLEQHAKSSQDDRSKMFSSPHLLNVLLGHNNLTDKAANTVLNGPNYDSDEARRHQHSIASNSNASGDIIDKLHNMNKNAREPSDALSESIAIHRNASKEALTDLANHPRNYLVKSAALMHKTTPQEVLAQHAANPVNHAALSLNPNTPAEDLRRIYSENKGKDYIYENLASNKGTPSDILKELEGHPDKNIAKSAARILKGRK